jgi:hypothetical protein
VPGAKGRRVIVPAKAEIIRRIFAEFLAGKTPRAIAGDLNADQVAPPRAGRSWNASTINGNSLRGCGILRNPLYSCASITRSAGAWRPGGETERARRERKKGELQREIARLVDAIAKGHGDPAVFGPRSTALHGELQQIDKALAQPPSRQVVALHPAVLAAL